MPQAAIDIDQIDSAPDIEPVAAASDDKAHGDIWAAVFDPQAEHRPELPISFQFRWGERTIWCRVVESQGNLSLRVTADLGPVPFSSERPARRARVQALCHRRFRLPQGDFSRTGTQRVVYSDHVPLHEPTTGMDVVTAIARLLLLGKPYFALLDTDERRSVRRKRRY